MFLVDIANYYEFSHPYTVQYFKGLSREMGLPFENMHGQF